MKIEKNIRPPELARGKPPKYPFSKMEVGDSVFVEGAVMCGKEYQAASKVGAYKGWKFSGRTVDGGLRIWRVE